MQVCNFGDTFVSWVRFYSHYFTSAAIHTHEPEQVIHIAVQPDEGISLQIEAFMIKLSTDFHGDLGILT